MKVYQCVVHPDNFLKPPITEILNSAVSGKAHSHDVCDILKATCLQSPWTQSYLTKQVCSKVSLSKNAERLLTAEPQSGERSGQGGRVNSDNDILT